MAAPVRPATRSCLQYTFYVESEDERRRRLLRRAFATVCRFLVVLAILAWSAREFSARLPIRQAAAHASPASPSAPPLDPLVTSFGVFDVAQLSALFHTLVSDFFEQPDGTMYVQTGDIPAMWLRDSSAQALPYVRFAADTPLLARWIRAVIERDARNILVDPYANAYTVHYRAWEQKWEVDSPAFPVVLAWTYWKALPHDPSLFTPRLHWALMRIVDVYACEQHHDRCSHYTHPELPEGGRGAGFTETGMLWSGFRPSDDPVRYPFNIPQQMLAAVALDELAVLAERGYGDVQLGLRARLLAAEVRAGIERYGRFYDFRYGWIYAYEVDGRGGVALMDDANLPSLLAAPYFGYVGSNDPVYRNTRAFVLSRDNPYYYRGRFAEGVGSAHTPANWVWPLALIARALTASSVQETASELAALARTDDEDGLVHESFDPNAYWKFTRTEFGWANAMYAELLFSRATAFDRSPPTGAGETFFSISSSPHRMAPSRVVSIADGLQNSAAIMRALRRALPQ